MLAELEIPSLIQLKEVPFFSDLGIKVTASPTPRIKAVTGFPIKSKKAFTCAAPKGVEGKSAIDFKAINRIGRRIGANDLRALGNFPYFSTRSSNDTSGFAGISNLLEIFNAYRYPTNMTGIEISKPTRITNPRSAFNVPAMIIGPGVGGTRQWVAYSPELKQVAITARETPDFAAKALLIGERMTKPESQKTGILTIYPVRLMVKGACFLPTTLRIVLAIVSAAPVFSRIVPIIVPAIITIPMLPRIEPNPEVRVVISLSTGIPHNTPTKYPESNNTMNGCHLNFEIKTTIPTIATIITKNRYHPAISVPLNKVYSLVILLG